MDRQTSWTLPIFPVQIQLALFPQLQCNVVGDQIYRLAVLKLLTGSFLVVWQAG